MKQAIHIHDRFPLLDNVLVEVWRVLKSGRHVLDDRFSTHNLVTAAGKDLAASYLVGPQPAAIGYFAIGTGSNAAALSDTALQSEIFRDLLTSAVQSSIGLASFTYYLGTLSLNGSTLSEIGLLNAVSAGTLCARALLTPSIAKINTKAVTFTWNVTYA